VKKMKRGSVKRNKTAVRTQIEHLETRHMLSGALTVNTALLVFNAVENSSVSPTETIIFTNTGNSPLTLGSGAFSLVDDPSNPSNDTARFSLLNASAAPATLAAGQNFTLQLDYNAKAVVTNSALLDITTSDPVNPVQVITLHGIGTKGLGGTNQPSLATILQAYNIPTFVGEGYDDDNAATDSTYPNPPDASSQEVALQRLVKAGPGDVSINVLASFTASGFSKSYVLGTYPIGNPGDLNQLFYTTAAENQTVFVQPQGSTSFDPGSSEFGFYFVSNVQVTGRIGYSEDSLNTWDTTNDRKIRFFPMETPTGTIVPNTYIMTSTEWNAPVGYDFTNIVAIVSNVKAAPDAPSAPKIALTNANAVPGSSDMVFNRIAIQNTAVGDTVHDTGVLTVSDSGNEPLIINSYSLSSQWQLVNPPTFPLTIQPGASQALTIKFIANSVPSVPYNETNDVYYPKGGGVYDGSLTLYSNDPTNPTSVTVLAGYFQTQSENSEEPGLQTITNLLFDYGTDINPTPITNLTESTATSGVSPTYYGEETVSPYWEEADTGAPVTVEQIAAFHTQGNTATDYWYLQGQSGTKNKLFETAADDGQSLFPDAINTTTPAATTFSTTGIFGFDIDGNFSDNALNPNTEGGGHHVRFYPVRDSSGKLVPNTYLMTMDYAVVPENFDFQDNVFLVTNIRPATVVSGISSPQTTGAPPTPADFYAAGTQGGVSLEWAPVADSTLTGYDIYRSSSLNGTYTLLNSTPITTTSYFDTTATAGSAVYYKLTAIDSATKNQSLAALSSTTALLTSTTVPSAPGNLTATGISGGITLNWSAVSDPTLAGYNVYSSSSASGPFTLLTSSPITATTYTDSTATVGATTYYQVTAVDASSGLSSTASTANGTALAVSGLQSLDIGASIAGSTTVVTPGTGFNVTAGGPGVADDADGFRFIYQTQTGNFDVAVQVTSLTVAGNYSTAGIMARSTLTTTSPDVYMSASPVNYRFKWRTGVGTVNNVTAVGTTTYPNVWVRLVRVGNLFTGYYSTNGTTWTVASSITLALPTTLDLGLAVASNIATATTTAQLRNYGNTVITTPTPPAAPTHLTATGVAGGVSLAWSAVADSTLKGYNVYSSSSATGTFTLLTPSPITATTFTDSTAVVGAVTYYEVIAVDGSSGLSSTPATANATALAVTGLQSIDIGASIAGSTTVVTPGTGFNVTAGGPGVADDADGFRFIYQTQTGNFDVAVQVTSLTVAGNFSTAGIMARSTLTTTSPDVYMSASPVNYRFKWRTGVGTVNNVDAVGTTTYPNVWVRLVRVGNLFTGYYSTNGTTWTVASSITLALPSTIDLGLAVASNIATATTTAQLRNYGNTVLTTPTPPAAPTSLTATGVAGGVSLAWSAVADSTLKGYNVYSSSSSTGTFKLLTSTPITTTSYTDFTAAVGSVTYYKVTAVDASSGLESTAATASATALATPITLTSTDIGASPAGSTTLSGNTYTVVAGGPGVTANVDGFRYLYTTQTGNFDVKVQVSSITVAGNFSTAGIMARSTLDADSANVYMSASPVNFRFKDRPTTNAATTIVSSGTPAYPNVWVRLQRVGNVFNGYTSTNGTTWTLMSSVTVALPTTIDLGLAVASNVSTTTTTAVLQDYSNT
jgi:fibronectin type 3 domain-containing protein/regulation of enolase protein 1 (concanavalin A-like superfamily)